MLNFLRQNKENVVIKIVLLVIVLSYAIYFGTTSMQSGSGNVQTAAFVNGEPISGQKAGYYIQQQMEQIKNIFKDNIPETIEQSTRQSVINSLINQELLAQELKKLGLVATKKELASQIKTNQQFFNNGKFDINYYKERFLPGYQLTFGSNFEKDQLKSIAQNKFFDIFESVYSASEKEIALENKLKNTTFQYTVVKVSKAIEPQANEETKTMDSEDKTTLSAKEKAEKIHPLMKDGVMTAAILKDLSLKERKTGFLSYSQLNKVFDGNSGVDNIKNLLKLTKENPVPEKILENDTAFFVVKLTDTKSPSTDDEGIEKVKTEVQQQLSRSLESSFISLLRSKADIRISAQTE